jgi:peptidase A4-like protein
MQLSSSWSGYVASTPPRAATALTFTQATGTWRVPKVTCTTSGTSAAFWVGIGVSADCEPNGKPLYRAWTEIVPDPGTFISLKVHPRDVITAAVVSHGQTVVGFSNIATTANCHMGVLTHRAWLLTPIALVSSNGAAHYTAKSNPSGAVPNPISPTGRPFSIGYRSTLARNVPPAPLPGAPLPNFVH